MAALFCGTTWQGYVEFAVAINVHGYCFMEFDVDSFAFTEAGVK